MSGRDNLIQFLRLAALETDDCVIWPGLKDGGGYGMVCIGLRKTWGAHRKALEIRVQRPSSKLLCLHGPCHNTACMNYRHLRWGTHSQNLVDRDRDGTGNRGVLHPLSKLTEEDLETIRRWLSIGRTQASIGRALGVSRTTIWRIASGQAYVGSV